MKLSQSGLIFGLCVLSSTIHGANGPENFAAITERNAFRLSTPKPESKIEVKPELPVVTLQGISALLDRRQALLKIQTGAKPNPTETCCILGEGQERNGVRVLRIDMESGTVWFTNQGAEQILTIKR
jgi:streptogramin lyase